MMRPSSIRSPRSVMRTTTERLLLRLTTRTRVPKGSVGWQAVSAFMSNRSPLAVTLPLNTPPYQEARPWSMSARRSALVLGALSAAVFRGARKAGDEPSTGAPGGAVAGGLESRAFACTAGVESVTTAPTSATDETPARSAIRKGVFRLVLRDFLRI